MVVSVTLSQLSLLLGRVISGLQATCVMFAGFKRVAPEHAVGMKLAESFLTAPELFNEKRAAS